MTGRTLSKGVQTRERVLDAVVAAVARDGIAKLSVAGIGSDVGMSSGHVLYHFKTKDALFVEALRHVEASLDADRAAIHDGSLPVVDRLRRYVGLYLPTSRDDARWSLWVQVWGTAATDPELRTAQLILDQRWQDDLARLVDEGIERGEFRPADRGAVLESLAALLDGIAVRMMTGADVSAVRSVELAESSMLALLGVGT